MTFARGTLMAAVWILVFGFPLTLLAQPVPPEGTPPEEVPPGEVPPKEVPSGEVPPGEVPPEAPVQIPGIVGESSVSTPMPSSTKPPPAPTPTAPPTP
jgi:hypothetical protein